MSEPTSRYSGIAVPCYDCLLAQARAACRFAALTPAAAGRVMAEVRRLMSESRQQQLQPQHIVRSFEEQICRERGLPDGFDIYGPVKELSNRRALEIAAACRLRIEQSGSPLAAGLQLAAAGNIIDFGAKAGGGFDLEQELHRLGEAEFDRCDLEPLAAALRRAGTVLYLCDNCGEIVLDMIFMETLKRLYPGVRIVAAVRERPVINDATLEDGVAIGLDRVVELISSGSLYPGTILAETSEAFRRVYAAAEVIVAKGQGNFETLLPVSDRRLFFLLRIKCPYMAELAGVAEGNLVLLQGGGAITGSDRAGIVGC